MTTRELSAGEWKTFFDCFSRRFHGRPVTVDQSDAPEGRADTVARQLPLIGVTLEPSVGNAELIAIMMGESRENVVHVVRGPSRVRVAQLSNGEDEMLLIDSSAGATTRIDFRSAKEAGPVQSV